MIVLRSFCYESGAYDGEAEKERHPTNDRANKLIQSVTDMCCDIDYPPWNFRSESFKVIREIVRRHPESASNAIEPLLNCLRDADSKRILELLGEIILRYSKDGTERLDEIELLVRSAQRNLQEIDSMIKNHFSKLNAFLIPK